MRNLLTYGWWTIVSCIVLTIAEFTPIFAADEPATTAHHADENAKESGHEKGAPLEYEPDLAWWSLTVFVVFVLVLWKFAWGPLIEGLDKREAQIRQDISDAESVRIRGEQMLAEHADKLDKVQDEIREILTEARRDADHTKNEIIAEAQREAQTTKQQAIDEIERSRDQALKELFDHMAVQVANATEHILGRSLTDSDQDRLIDEALQQVSQQSDKMGISS